LNKLIANFDADFPHDGVKVTSGAAVLLNGAEISWKTRRQTTVSLTSTEAEVKAMVPGVEIKISDWPLGRIHAPTTWICSRP
jgi:hypothetical protein